MTRDTALGPGREFDVVRELIARWGERASGIGDDAAVLDVPTGERLVVSTDSSVEHAHFRREWLTAREIGYRATAAALSDLAAMAAAPLGVVVALSCPESWLAELGHIAEGIGDVVAHAGTHVVGGDLTAANELVLAITVLGSSPAPLERRGARPGDQVYVTGALGGPLAALDALLAGHEPSPAARARFVHPTPRIREARWLAARGAHAMIDISDGLLGDAAHIAAASGVRLVLDLDALPTVDGARIAEAVRSGEEYELIAVSPVRLDATAFEHDFGIPLTHIGRVEAGAPGVEAYANGERVASGAGFNHFS
ncbi:MAG TPA: thiamine-phosphate kinase [Gemmatimonadaceae bacterium]